MFYILELDTFRQCIKSCKSAISIDSQVMSAYLLQGKALCRIGKHNQAILIWNACLAQCQINSDFYFISELKKLISQTQEGSNQKSSAMVSALRPLSEDSEERYLEKKNDKTRSTLISIHQHLVGETSGKISPSILEVARNSLSYATGDEMVDDLLTVGNIFVNSNQNKEACELFHAILQWSPNTFAALIGVGSAEALLHQFDDAINHFTKAIHVDPTVWYRCTINFITSSYSYLSW